MQKISGKIDKVLSVCIETIYNTRTWDKVSAWVLPFFYLTIGSFNFFKHSEEFCCLLNYYIKHLAKGEKLHNFTGFKCILVCPIYSQNKYCAKVCRFCYNNKINPDNQGLHRWKAKVCDSLLSNLHNASCSKNSIVEYSRLLLLHLWAMICRKDTKRGLIHVFIPISFCDYTQVTQN